jgi:hypothetical protein
MNLYYLRIDVNHFISVTKFECFSLKFVFILVLIFMKL